MRIPFRNPWVYSPNVLDAGNVCAVRRTSLGDMTLCGEPSPGGGLKIDVTPFLSKMLMATILVHPPGTSADLENPKVTLWESTLEKFSNWRQSRFVPQLQEAARMMGEVFFRDKIAHPELHLLEPAESPLPNKAPRPRKNGAGATITLLPTLKPDQRKMVYEMLGWQLPDDLKK